MSLDSNGLFPLTSAGSSLAGSFAFWTEPSYLGKDFGLSLPPAIQFLCGFSHSVLKCSACLGFLFWSLLLHMGFWAIFFGLLLDLFHFRYYRRRSYVEEEFNSQREPTPSIFPYPRHAGLHFTDGQIGVFVPIDSGEFGSFFPPCWGFCSVPFQGLSLGALSLQTLSGEEREREIGDTEGVKSSGKTLCNTHCFTWWACWSLEGPVVGGFLLGRLTAFFALRLLSFCTKALPREEIVECYSRHFVSSLLLKPLTLRLASSASRSRDRSSG